MERGENYNKTEFIPLYREYMNTRFNVGPQTFTSVESGIMESGENDYRTEFIPLYREHTNTRFNVGPQTFTSVNSDTAHKNRIEVNILPNKDLSLFIKKVILIFFVLITSLVLTLSLILFLRILQIEQESSRLIVLTLQAEAKLSGLAEELNKLKESNLEYWDTVCLDLNSNDTEAFSLDISLEEEIEDEEETDNDMVNRSKRQTLRKETDRQRNNGDRRNGGKKKKRQRIICHKCNTVPSKNLTRNKIKRINRPSNLFPLSDMSAIHLKGKLPEVYIYDGGAIGPWIYDASTSPDGLKDFKLQDDNLSLIVLKDGYFFIYAQVYYLSSGETNSYSVVRKENASLDKNDILATCSSGAGNFSLGREESCFTATLRRLQKGDRLQLTERDVNRTVLFREGQTYFGLVRVSPSRT